MSLKCNSPSSMFNMFDGKLIQRPRYSTLDDAILAELKENAFLFNISIRLEDTENQIKFPLHGIHRALILLGVPFDENWRVLYHYHDMIDKYLYEMLDNPKGFMSWVREELAAEEDLSEPDHAREDDEAEY
jgi:hypothetical protein